MSTDTDIDDLYRLAPGEFVTARDARAAAARAAGDRHLAASLRSLRRPSVAAWLANWLVRERADDVNQLLEIGAQLRRAQAELAAQDLRQLSRARHQVVSALSAEARRGATVAGVRVSAAAGRELEETLEAAMADEDAELRLRTGRLTAALHYSGFDATENGTTGRASGRPGEEQRPSTEGGSPPAVDEVGARRQARRAEAESTAAREQEALVEERRRRVQEAQAELQEAEADADRSRTAAERCEQLLAAAEAREAQARRTRAEVEERLATLRDEEQETATATAAAREAKADAEHAAVAGRGRADELRRQLERLGDEPAAH